MFIRRFEAYLQELRLAVQEESDGEPINEPERRTTGLKEAWREFRMIAEEIMSNIDLISDGGQIEVFRQRLLAIKGLIKYEEGVVMRHFDKLLQKFSHDDLPLISDQMAQQVMEIILEELEEIKNANPAKPHNFRYARYAVQSIAIAALNYDSTIDLNALKTQLDIYHQRSLNFLIYN